MYMFVNMPLPLHSPSTPSPPLLPLHSSPSTPPPPLLPLHSSPSTPPPPLQDQYLIRRYCIVCISTGKIRRSFRRVAAATGTHIQI